jgi:hypothetical protein
MSVIPALQRERQEDSEFKVSLGYMLRSCVKKPKRKKREKRKKRRKEGRKGIPMCIDSHTPLPSSPSSPWL